MRLFHRIARLPLVLGLATALLVAPLLMRPAAPSAPSADALTRSAYRTLLTVSAVSYLLLGALGLTVYRRSQRPRHWHPRVGPLSPVQVRPSGELSQPVSRHIRPYARRTPNSQVG